MHSLQPDAASNLRVTIEQQETALIVRIDGDARVRDVDELDRQLRPVAASRPRLVIVSLEGMTFISSLALGILVSFQRGLERSGCTVRFAAAQAGIAEVLRGCRLDSVFKLYSDVDSALQSTEE